MKYASVCSGVEAASLAWKKLGWEPVLFAEVEPFPCAVLQQRFNATKPFYPLDPADATSEKDKKMRQIWMNQIKNLPETGTIKNYGDFTKIKGKDYVGTIDLLVGGTPCQDLSVAGKRAGFGNEEKRKKGEKTRSSLALDFVKLAYETQCKWIVWENVPGVFSSNNGRDFATFLSWFVGYRIEPPKEGWKTSGIACNVRPDRFGLAWRVLDAQFTRVSGFPYAIPQRRRRVFVVGCFGDWERAATVLLEPDRLSWNTPSRIQTREETSRHFKKGIRNAIAIGNGQVDNAINMQMEVSHTLHCMHDHEAIIEVAGTLKARNASSPFPERGQTVVLDKDPNIICFHGSQNTITNETHANTIGRNCGQENCICYDNQTYARNPEPTGDISCTIQAHCGTGGNTVPLVQNVVAITENVIGRKIENGGNGIGAQDELAYTQNASGVMGIAHYSTVRRIMPIECERLMGFPDEHTRISWNGKPESECPDGPRYKACGNSMCVNCMEWIERRIEQYD